jgi:triosephosphate isomerase
MTEHNVQANIRRQLVAGNWKMNGDKTLVDKMQEMLSGVNLDNMDVVICPPFPYLGLFDSQIKL